MTYVTKFPFSCIVLGSKYPVVASLITNSSVSNFWYTEHLQGSTNDLLLEASVCVYWAVSDGKGFLGSTVSSSSSLIMLLLLSFTLTSLLTLTLTPNTVGSFLFKSL